MQIAQIAQQKYGGSISMAVMSPEVQQLVRLYALETGKGAALPRPMYAATLSEGASGLNLLPVYAGGQAVANPYSGTTTTQWSSFGAGTGVYVQLDPGAAAQLMTGQVVNILANNPGSVAAAASAGIQSGVTRDATAQSLIAPLTVMR